MKIAYNIFIHLYGYAVYLSSFFYPKAKLWLNGRKNWENELASLASVADTKVWIHCASLGEFEQARPLLERLRENGNNVFILLTFFSPSGFEVRKNYPLVNKVTYLPLDTAANAQKFVSLVQPTVAIFTKYDIWHNYLYELKLKNIPTLLFSATFRADQHYFKWYGAFFQQSLRCFSKIYVQNETSQKLLQQIEISATIAPDTRFDRVKSIAHHPQSFPLLAKLKNESKVIVAGSTWPADELLLQKTWSTLKQLGYTLIIAPHDINEHHLQSISELFDTKPQLFSQLKSATNISVNDLILVDTIGDLTSIYNYGHVAYVGGGFNASIHNVLEPATFGLPVFFGPNFKKSLEAMALMELSGAFCVKNDTDFLTLVTNLSEEQIIAINKINIQYINDHLGGTEIVYNYIEQQISA